MNMKLTLMYELENFSTAVHYHVIAIDDFEKAMDAYADRILSKVRESLLSDEAIEAGNKALPDYDRDTDAGDVVKAMLDAIT